MPEIAQYPLDLHPADESIAIRHSIRHLDQFSQEQTTLNILFISYGDIRSNSMGHIDAYADELTKLGHACVVAVEANDSLRPDSCGSPLYRLISHGELYQGTHLFADGREACIIHAWTPREIVRVLTEAYRARHPSTKVVVHLEDNEEVIASSFHQKPFSTLLQEATTSPEKPWHPRLSHPLRYREFLAAADSVTLITESLYRFLPLPRRFSLLSPIFEFPATIQRVNPIELRNKYGIPQNRKLVVFPGGITASNRADIRNLYTAVNLLNKKGTPTLLIKTGPPCPEFANDFSFDINEISIDLGYLQTSDVRDLLLAADVLIQPGADNDFNRDRLPCKIPEFFSAGRPCIIPRFHCPNPVSERPVCLTLESSSPEEIATQAQHLFEQPALAAKIAANALAYARSAYAARSNTQLLLDHYKQTLQQSISPPDKLSPDTLRKQHDSLAQKLQLEQAYAVELAEQTKNLKNLIASMRIQHDAQLIEIEEWRKRDERRRRTFSWQITSPLRFARRLLLDPIQRQRMPTPPPAAEAKIRANNISLKDQQQIRDDHICFTNDYHRFVATDEMNRVDYLANYSAPPQGPERPKISILLPVYDIADNWLRRCVDSVLSQAYPNWELCIADDCSPNPSTRLILEEYRLADQRIRVVFRKINGHIARATNSAFELATGDYIALLDHDDELPPHALARVVETISENPQAKLIYSDEDKIGEDGLRHSPHFKTDWNYDLFLSCNFMNHFCIYRRDAFEEASGFRPGFEGAQDWDLGLRVAEKCGASEIVHIPEILYHWRAYKKSTAVETGHKPYAHDAQRRALCEHFSRIGEPVELESICGIHWRIIRRLKEPFPTVSIIIPTKDQVELLQACISSILNKTEYNNFEIVIIDNASQEDKTLAFLKLISKERNIRVIKDNRTPFNYSAINNNAIHHTKSDIICLLNNDTEVIEGAWLRELVSNAARPEIGAVGAKLLFPNNFVQHAGVIIGLGGVADHAFKFTHRDEAGHMYRAQRISQISAVTGACMAFRRVLWEEIGGLDEEHLAITYNDTDFCLRLMEKGYRNLFTPYALLYHKESATRGGPSDPMQLALFHEEAAYMCKRWRSIIKRDPFYNPNFSLVHPDFRFKS